MTGVPANKRHAEHDGLDDFHFFQRSHAGPVLVGASADVCFPARAEMFSPQPPAKRHAVRHLLLGLERNLHSRTRQLEIHEHGTKDLWGVRNGCCWKTSRRKATLWPMMLPARGAPPLEVLATTWDQEGRAAATIQGDSGVWRTVRYSEGPTETSAPLSMPLTSEDNQWGPGRESLSMSAMISPSANVAPMFLSFQ